MRKKKYIFIKRKKHEQYVKRKRFYRNFGRKFQITLSTRMRKERSKQHFTNKNKKINLITKEHVVIDLPAILSLEPEYRTDFLKEIKNLQKYLSLKQYRCSIDHSKIERIDPEALLVLAAEIKRSANNGDKRFLRYDKAYAPKNEQVIRMLNSIGYWEHFNINLKNLGDIKRRYLKILHDTEANNLHVVELREFFNSKLNFLPLDTTEMFDNAISEAIANSVEHAYIKDQNIRTINRAWWLSGSYNMDTNELFFGCYDQGIGVKEALGHHDNRLVMKWVDDLKLMNQSDSNVLETLVTKELPKYKNTDRGHGFKHFIKFIEDYSHGSLNIYSKHGEYKAVKQEDSMIRSKYDYTDSLDGTLIVWKIKLEGGEHDNL